MKGQGWWVLAAGALGFASSFIFSSVLGLERSSFVLVHTIVVGAFLTTYAVRAGVDPMNQLRRRWLSGVLAGIVIGLGLIQQVSAQPPSARPEGVDFVGAALWYGAVYGTADALLLSVVPVVALYGFRSPEDLARGGGRLRWAAVALLGSGLITAAYHLGFTEFRGPALLQPLIGNALMTLAYLLSGSPLGAIVSHVLMHVAAVWHGMATTLQLPPHY